jgi:hypothetical protein
MRPDNFSYEGQAVLFEALEQLGEDTGHEVELDVVALCCEFSEATRYEIIENFSINTNDADNEEDETELVMNYLQENTFVCGTTSNGSIVYQDF